MIAQAKKHAQPPNVQFEVADARTLPYAACSFDAVVISNALHVMPEPERALAEIRRVLRTGGLF